MKKFESFYLTDSMKRIVFLRSLRDLQKKMAEYMFLRNPLREYYIKKAQQQLLRDEYPPDSRRLIIFFAPGYDSVSGGILSINSMYSETKKLSDIHASKVIMCTVPSHPLLIRYTKFANTNRLMTFSIVLHYFKNIESMMIHIPDFAVRRFVNNLSRENYSQLISIKDLHINILLQNIELIPTREHLDKLKRLGKLTSTTAHEAYTTSETEELLGCPIHKLSTYISPNQYSRTTYSDKENLMIISPDTHDLRSRVLGQIAKCNPQLRLQVIKNLSYEQYKKLISRAKWALTLGEGLDGYFIESVFSGGIGFAVYNTNFFTPDFKALQTVYPNHESLIQDICRDIERFDCESSYTRYQNEQYVICSKYYDFDEYIGNLKSFYANHYPRNRSL